MPYDRQIPDAPIAGSMLPRAPYIVAIGGAIEVYADGKSRFELMEYL